MNRENKISIFFLKQYLLHVNESCNQASHVGGMLFLNKMAAALCLGQKAWEQTGTESFTAFLGTSHPTGV